MRKYARKGEIEAFLSVSLASDTNECICWPFARNSAGYGHLSVAGRHTLAHRVVCERAHGAPPFPKAEGAHTCGNGHLGCINPRHLRWKDRKSNAADMVAHGKSQRGARMHAARLTEDDVRFIWANPEISTRELAAKFGVRSGTVHQVRIGKTWRWLTSGFPDPSLLQSDAASARRNAA